MLKRESKFRFAVYAETPECQSERIICSRLISSSSQPLVFSTLMSHSLYTWVRGYSENPPCWSSQTLRALRRSLTGFESVLWLAWVVPEPVPFQVACWNVKVIRGHELSVSGFHEVYLSIPWLLMRSVTSVCTFSSHLFQMCHSWTGPKLTPWAMCRRVTQAGILQICLMRKMNQPICPVNALFCQSRFLELDTEVDKHSCF